MTTYRATAGLVLVVTLLGWCGVSSRYRSLGHLSAVGHGVHKTVAVPLDLAGLTHDTVTLRLESGAGFWAIDWVGIGFSPTEPPAVHTVNPAAACDQNGRDLRDALRAEDGVYYVMPITEDRAELAFEVSPKRASFERTFVLEASGYYTMHVDPQGEPRSDLLAKFLFQPNALCAYSIRRYNEMTSRSARRDGP